MSVNEKRYVEKVLNQYQEREVTKLDELKALDKKARKAPLVFANVFGSISCLVLGFGMCVAMKVIFAELFLLGLIVGIVGLTLCVLNYFIYKAMLKKSKAKYASQITKLSEELLNN